MAVPLALSDTLLQIVALAPVSFAFGVLVGFALSNRYRITKRNGKEDP